MTLSAEDQAMWDVMEIAGFPIEFSNGLYKWDTRKLGFPSRMMSREDKQSTPDFSDVIKLFEFWKRYHNGS